MDAYQRYATDMANRLILRTLLATVARLAQPADPREFVAQVEQACSAQVAESEIIEGLSQEERAKLRKAILEAIRDTTGRLDWGDT